mgnify:CR=1 FL=1
MHFALLLYIFISIYIDERKISQEIAQGVYADKEAFELIKLHKYNDIELVIPVSNLELLESSPKKYMILDQTKSIELYEALISGETTLLRFVTTFGFKPLSLTFLTEICISV